MPDTAPPDSPENSGDLLDLAFPYALDAVDSAEGAEIEQRVRAADPATVRAFEGTVRDVREAMAALSVLDARTPPARIEARILAALDHAPGARSAVRQPARPAAPHDDDLGSTAAAHAASTETGAGHTDELARARRQALSRRWIVVGAAAAVVVAIGIAVGVGVVAQRGDEPAGSVTAQEVLAQPDARTASVPIGPGGTLTVHVSDVLGAATVSFDATPAPPPGSDYQLWLIDASGTPRSAGVLTGLPGAGDPYVTEFTGSDQLAITLEPDGGSPAPTGDPLAAVALG
ncbi:anti-sigma factor [Nocardia rhamnosiphila]|uniref:anti-sigma factor n=1 Tax=Nocardia rhamnosiphila TaxID=426716 RepID=UPI0004C34BB4|nr:anti-sigma factor [Nocardia rhamnosiphila]